MERDRERERERENENEKGSKEKIDRYIERHTQKEGREANHEPFSDPSFQNVARKILVKKSKKVRKLESYEWRNKSGLAPHFTISDVQHKVSNTKYYKMYAYPLAHKIKAACKNTAD